MTRFSANLGFLWTELALPEAIRRAKSAGFEAVELHWPYETDEAEINAALSETGLPLLGLNTVRGDVAAGDNGLAAIAGREEEARAAIMQAIDYAHATNCSAIHVMAGRDGDEETFITNLRFAAEEARDLGKVILIEPLNLRDAPDYFLHNVEQAAELIALVGANNVKIMFDAYHVQIMQGDLTKRLQAHLPMIGHIQIAACPTRTEPNEGEVCFERFLASVDDMGWDGFVGAEYKPRSTTDAGLGWMDAYR